MPDLQPVFEELRRRLSLHEDVFRPSVNITDANASGSRKVVDPAPDTSYLLLGAATEKYRTAWLSAGSRSASAMSALT
jgi:hypothetical protein